LKESFLFWLCPERASNLRLWFSQGVIRAV